MSNSEAIFSAVNLSSQITLLSRRISYVFFLLSSFNLPLSCPEPFCSQQSEEERGLQGGCLSGNPCKRECSSWFPAQCFLLPTGLRCLSGSISVCISQSKCPRACLHHFLLGGSLSVITQLRYTRGGQADIIVSVLHLTTDIQMKR